MSGLVAYQHPGAGGEDVFRDALAALAYRHPEEHRVVASRAELGVRGDTNCIARDGGVVVAADARIDNLDELRRAGLSVPEGATAAEVVLRAYRRWGRSASSRLVGDFAFVVVDDEENRLLASRDALGVKSLFYHRRPGELLVASEKQALVASALFPSRPNRLAIALFIAAHHREIDDTLYEGVSALPPGHTLEVSGERFELHRDWSPDPWRAAPSTDERELAALFRDTLGEAVRCRMGEPRHLGIELSGGLDSSAVASQAGRFAASAEAPTALHLTFAGMPCEETTYGKAVAEMWGLRWHAADAVTDDEATRVAMDHPDLLYHPTEACFMPLLRAARRDGIRTVLTGMGGDQWLDENSGDGPDALAACDLKDVVAITGIGQQPFSGRPYRKLVGFGIRGLLPEPARLVYRRVVPRGPLPLLRSSWSARVNEVVDDERRARRPWRYPSQSAAEMCDEVERFSSRMPLGLSELVGSRLGLEITHPFFDRRVFELMLTMPRAQRLRCGVLKGKPLLRRALKTDLPPEVLERKGAAIYSCYIDHLFLTRRRSEIQELISNSRLADLGIVEPAAARETLEARMADPLSAKHLVLLISMELWLRKSWS
ncbi:MAG TPA: asparagine synthetase B [Polyangiaceae bacterium]|nr:asparagine synthetase B [Polyangiaceae bacterium]